MPGFSDPDSSSFDNLSLQHIRALLELLASTGLRRKEHIRRRYLERASHFDVTVRFLEQLKIVRDKGVALSTKSRRALRHDLRGDELNHVLIKRLLHSETPLREELCQYLRQFRIVGNKAVYRPTPDQRSAESALRNLLMEMAIVSHDRENEEYVLDSEHASLYAAASSLAGVVPPSQIRKRQKAREEIGLAAERAIVAYERQRLGDTLAKRVDHVAARNAAAGYDIQSVSVIGDATTIPRFIEVKAVSPTTLGFYWTANEVTVAHSLGSWYCLYLLPVDTRSDLRLDLLRVISNPHATVLANPDQWDVEHNVLRCQMKHVVDEQG